MDACNHKVYNTCKRSKKKQCSEQLEQTKRWARISMGGVDRAQQSEQQCTQGKGTRRRGTNCVVIFSPLDT